jgi:hypothetical protein
MTANTATQVPILVQLQLMFMVSHEYRWHRHRNDASGALGPKNFSRHLLRG